MVSRPLSKPGTLLLMAYRSPIYIYRLHLGWLFGTRFLMLSHRGRHTGRLHHTVLEVIRYDKETGDSIVVSAYGENADWYRNIQAAPAEEVHTGMKRFTPVQRFLTPDETYEEFVTYERHHPSAVRILTRLLGRRYDCSQKQRIELAASLRMVSFRPLPR